MVPNGANGAVVPNEAVAPNAGAGVEFMDEIAPGANGLEGLPVPNANGGLLGTVDVEVGAKLKPPVPNADWIGVGVVLVDVNVKLLGIVKEFVVEEAGNEIVAVVTAGIGGIVEELNKFEVVAVLDNNDEADVFGANTNVGG